MKTALIVNSGSRLGVSAYERAIRELEAVGVSLDSKSQTGDVRQFQLAMREAVQTADLVIVGGGDGTLNMAVPWIVRGGKVLGVLPLGTGNSFARDLGIPASLGPACKIIRDANEVRVDVGMAGDYHFLNVATVGLTTQIAMELRNIPKRRFGKFSYVLAVLHALRKARPFHACIYAEHGEEHLRTVQIVVGNGRFHAGPFVLSQDASIISGKLVVYAVRNQTRWSLLKFALRLPTGTQLNSPDVVSFIVPSCRVETTPTRRITVDGEVCERTPLDFKVLPGELRVLAPDKLPTGKPQQEEAATQ